MEGYRDLNPRDVNGQVTKVTWRIENFSRIKDKKLCSEIFTVDGNKWRLIIYPRGTKGKNLGFWSIFFAVADSATLPSGWSRYAHFGLAVIDQFHRENSKTLVKTDADKLKTKEADCVKAAMDNQKTTSTKPVEITNPSPTSPSCQIMATEPEEPTEEDMNTFFTSLESKLWSSNTIFSREEAKEALAKVEKALNMAPVNFYEAWKLSPLKHAFNILASFDCSSTTLTLSKKKSCWAWRRA
ncbi:hypothetical protein V6Z11_A10G229000 [Gossypium hirsutum]|uniref:MATH domain and coiled-coil domain-containing protein At2g42475 isoform X2 n=1 Tax=Gossypium hirsutum TaxID=3635 RepID=A0A1U8IM27_GOSHI|nr:MATH domain and coiled-coil domain-containing protein At2g42475 isoform X2 [Gossypium hirsutum]